MKTRYIKEIGTIARFRIYWDRVTVIQIDPCNKCSSGHPRFKYLNTCSNTYGHGNLGGHNAYAPLGTSSQFEAWKIFGNVEDYPLEKWPLKCDWCDALVPIDNRPSIIGEIGECVNKQIFVQRQYNSPSGFPEPGDLYFVNYHDPGQCPFWDNCDGKHLRAILPNKYEWDLDGRANNCTMKEDRIHRCWIRTGNPENGIINVGKSGLTCSAGAGSISVPGYHGFLRNGHFT
jgi:hypothetical protein